MSVEFNHNGNSYEIINDNEVRLTNLSSTFGDNDFIPKYAMYQDKRYTVTEIGLVEGGSFTVWERVNINANDKRKKPEWKYQVKEEHKRASVFRNSWNKYPSYLDLIPEMNSLTQLVVPNSVKKIHRSAFNKCQGLTTLTIADSVTEIGPFAFACCYNLLELKIPNSVTEIGEGAFLDPKSLKKLKLPNKIKKIPKRMFESWRISCNEVLTSITIPSSVEEIGELAFDAFKNLKEVEICNEPGEVMIAVNAFPSSAKITYTGKKAQPKCDAPKTDVDATPAPTIDLDKLIEAVVADGVITDKERAVILKKATAAGYDADEVEILLDGKLAEKESKSQSVPETKVEAEVEPAPASSAEKNDDEDVDAAVDTDAMWADVVSKLDVVQNRITCPKGRPYMSFVSKTHKKNISYWAGYSPRGEFVWVCIETYGGEAARDAIMAIVEKAPKGHICAKAEMKQGARNKDKWALTVTTSIDKPTSELVEWYADNLLAFYKLFEDAKPF